MCEEKLILYNNQRWRTQWLDQEETQKHLPKPNLHQKKVMVSVWWFYAGLIYYSFLNPGETIISELSKSMRCTENCNALQLTLVNRNGPILLHDNAQLHVAQPLLQVEQIGLWSFTSSVLPHSLDLSPTNYHFFKRFDNFCQRKWFRNKQETEMLSKSSLNPKARIFML